MSWWVTCERCGVMSYAPTPTKIPPKLPPGFRCDDLSLIKCFKCLRKERKEKSQVTAGDRQ